jgi:phosphotransferase system IIB component
MKKSNVIMVYEGEFSQDITKSFLSMTESNFQTAQVNESIIKKIYNIMMEALQNICKHEFKVQGDDLKNTKSLFIISENDHEYQIITGNAIKENVINTIKDKIEKVNSLDQEGLKALYKEARLNSTISEVGGAGLGFIDIARKSGNKISYHFESINETVFYFIQMVTVNKL